MNSKGIILGIIGLAMLNGSFAALAGSQYSASTSTATMQVERYSTVNESATAAQINPLLSVASFRFPQSVATVGDAVDTVLRYSGYELAPTDTLPLQLVTVLSKPLPMVDRTLGPLTTQDALLVLVGKGLFSLNQDPIQRNVNFHYLGKVPPESKTKPKKTTLTDAQLNAFIQIALASLQDPTEASIALDENQKILTGALIPNQPKPSQAKTGA